MWPGRLYVKLGLSKRRTKRFQSIFFLPFFSNLNFTENQLWPIQQPIENVCDCVDAVGVRFNRR